jgi:EAL domain-containing protein (putative c-di-GMP-specific phosphodiesterase class I)/DNA-binding NarL/FixJ family response regulator
MLDMKTLIIDDDAFMLKLMSQQLLNLGIADVVAHTHAADALALIEFEGVAFELVLCDLQMPDMDGIEVVRRLARAGYTGNLVLVSGEDDRILRAAETLAKSQKIHVLGVLHKPVSLEQLKAMLAKNVPPAAKTVGSEHPSYRPDEVLSALTVRELCNVYQPKVDLATGAVVGLETLVRWNHPHDGLVTPDQFIEVAEQNDLIDELTLVVLGDALRQARLWRDAGHDLTVSVNVSMNSLVSLSFPDLIANEVLQSGLPASRLILEVTESRLMQDPVAVLDILTRLRLKGITLSIDDFGTGYSSLAQLRDLPFQELKVDRGFVHRAHSSASLRAIFESSISMAQKIGLTTVAEGVEDRADWDFLRTSGCDIAQGFFIAKPMPASEFDVWLSSWQTRRIELGFDAASTMDSINLSKAR